MEPPIDGPDQNDKEYKDAKEHYTNRRSYLEKTYAENIQLLDQHLVLLPAGALVFTISIIEVLKPFYSFWWLLVIWTVFTLSLFSRLLSSFTGEQASNRKITNLDKHFKEYKDGIVAKFDLNEEKKNPVFHNWTHYLNTISLALFILGAVLFLGYAVTAAYFQEDKLLETKLSHEQYIQGEKSTNQFGTGGNPPSPDTKGNAGSPPPIQMPNIKSPMPTNTTRK